MNTSPNANSRLQVFSKAEARAIAVHAQGFNGIASSTSPDGGLRSGAKIFSGAYVQTGTMIPGLLDQANAGGGHSGSRGTIVPSAVEVDQGEARSVFAAIANHSGTIVPGGSKDSAEIADHSGAAGMNVPERTYHEGVTFPPDSTRPTAFQSATTAYQPASLLDVLDHLSVFQIDSVNVFERAHYMPAFSRIGAYDRSLLDQAHSPTDGSPATLIEYWAHEAAFIRVEDLPRHLWRMRKYREKAHDVGQDFATANRPLFAWLLDYLADVGPLTASEVEHPSNVRKPGTWWHHNDVKRALEIMFTAGQVVSAGRKGFSRRYGVPEQVLPAHVLAEMNREGYDAAADREYLLTLAAKRFGIATGRDLADYHRQLFTAARPHIDALIEAGILVPCKVEDSSEVFYRHVDTVLQPPAHVGTTVVSPFDPLVWHRPRTEGLFDFHYRIEIYTPEPKRIFGYYTLPILHNGQVVGRIDLKSDRQAGVLIAKASWHEAWLSASQTRELAKSLALHLREVAAWQGLSRVEIATRGNLAAALAKEVLR